ncbi:beta-galactosidase [Arthrobacter sp. H35-D1]|uniref:beta-galactosidase n=1 Tax=Arthrobacter sp. H35-D1 TaxID=3046202 RepID=UPI0024B89D50|nr:beta-galactosidase [Arthrobacter sp. H35-D1]MDJ0315085.1 beta-galactosidase [Arthrobacter sp. H35-D1]
MTAHSFRGSGRSRGLKAAAIMATAAMGLMTISSPALAIDSETTVETVAESAMAGDKVVFPGNDGQSHEVTFDSKSFMVDGERLNVWSGEFHYWRLPGTDDWRDMFQKMRASGFNAVSLYFFWGLHSTESGEFDFTGIKDIELLLTMAEEEGLYVIARPGPYVNAEISMGGLPAYLTKNGARSLRSTDPEALRESLGWINAFNEIAVKHQVTDGGGSIVTYQAENELYNEDYDRVPFMKELVEKIKGDGVTVPVFHNGWGFKGDFNPGSDRPSGGGDTGLDFYAFDQYPLGFNCSAGRGQVPDMESRFRAMTTTSPMFIAEGQGGAFTPWGANFNTDRCAEFVDPAFTRQYGVNNLNNGINMFNYYMQYGGTNWGWTGSPSSGFTSYDYGAAINEDRQLTPKASVQKELGYFQRDFDPISNMVPQPGAPVTIDGGAGNIKSYQRIATENVESESVSGNGSRYLGFRQGDSNSTTELSYSIPLTLSPQEEVVAASYTADDRDPAITYTGTWGKSNGEGWAAGNYKGTETFSDKTGDSVSYKFTGAGIRVISAQSINHGYGDVYIDGEKVGQTNTFRGQNANFQYVAFQTDGLDPNIEHTIKIVVTGEKDAASSGTNVTIDAFDVIAAPDAAVDPVDVKVDDVDPAITFSETNGVLDWSRDTGKTWTENDYMGTESNSNKTGAYYEYTFKAAEVRLISATAYNHAIGDVYIDGEKVGQTNTYQVDVASTPGQIAFEKTGLDPTKEHTIKVVNTGVKGDPAAKGTFLSIDAIETSTPAATDPEVPGNSITFDRVPQKAGTFLKLHGRDANMVIADYAFADQKLMYSTSELFTKMPVDNGSLLVLNGAKGDDGETVLQYDSEPTVATLDGTAVEHVWDADTKMLRLNYVHGNATSVKITGGGAPDLTIVTTDRSATALQWSIDGIVKDGTTNKTVMVDGADLVRSAEFDGDTVNLVGDTKEARNIGIYVPAGITKASWNGEALATTPGTNGQLVADLAGPAAAVLPALTDWKVSGENPESAVEFDDSAWLEATATTAANTRQGPGPIQGKVLDTAFYGFYEGDTWYRAHFTADSAATSIKLRGQGGSAANMLVWVNGAFAGAAAANGRMQTIQVPAGVIKKGEEAVVSAVVRNQGQNLDWSDNGLSRENRGLFDAELPANGEVTWKLQGAKDKAAPVDTARTMYNTGGLYGERAGWYLPDYPDSEWADADSFKPAKAGVTWYRTNFELNVPEGTDTAVALKINDAKFEEGRNSHARAVIYVNGWNTGTWVGNVGPQGTFTIPSGFLNKTGGNTLAIALTTERDAQGPDSFTLVDRGTSLGGVPTTLNTAPDYTLPVVAAEVDKAKHDVGEKAVVSGTSALAAIGDGALTNAVIDFGDGSEAVTVPVVDGAFSAERSFAEKGPYTAMVAIKDAVSGSVLGTDSVEIAVAGEGTAPTETAAPSESATPSDTAAPTASATPSGSANASAVPTASKAASQTPAADATTAANNAAAEDDLANTGANNKLLGGMAILLLLAGATVFGVSRRKQASH